MLTFRIKWRLLQVFIEYKYQKVLDLAARLQYLHTQMAGVVVPSRSSFKYNHNKCWAIM